MSVDAKTTINASATGRGNGGKVVLWSDSQTTFAGTILASGGAQGGDGGFVETSSHGQLAFTGNVDTGAPRGTAGTLLLDPRTSIVNCEWVRPTAIDSLAMLDERLQLRTSSSQQRTHSTRQSDDIGDIFVDGGTSPGAPATR